MSKFNKATVRTAPAAAPLAADPGLPTTTHQGGPGWRRGPKTDVFLLATTSTDLTADAFYESGDARVLRYVDLIRKLAVTDPQWTYEFLVWLRTGAYIRTAAVVGAVEAARAMAASGIPGGRPLIAHVLSRPDEPGEAVAYHLAKYGRKMPKPVKRGIADAAVKLYSERSLLKYDTASHAVRFADVLELTHAKPTAGKEPWQRDLFTYALNRRHGRDDMVPASLRTIITNGTVRALMAEPVGPEALGGVPSADLIAAAGLTWEDVLSALGSKVDKRALWKALIPSMGYEALRKNLRNFDQAGLTDADVAPVIARLTDPAEVAKSRQLPLRFLSAYRAVNNLRWAYPLEQALTLSLGNVPALGGRTLILVDTSQSMDAPLSTSRDRGNRPSNDPGLMRWDAAVAFGLALAARCEHADVVSFSDNHYGRGATRVFPMVKGESLLKSIERWKTGGYFINAGTDTAGALHAHYDRHDRVVILTDEQTGTGRSYGDAYAWRTVGRERVRAYVGPGLGDKVTDQMPVDRPLYTWNLAGYESSHAATDPYRVLLGGLTDAMFAVIPRVEAGRSGSWPWVKPGEAGWKLPQPDLSPRATTGRGPVG